VTTVTLPARPGRDSRLGRGVGPQWSGYETAEGWRPAGVSGSKVR